MIRYLLNHNIVWCCLYSNVLKINGCDQGAYILYLTCTARFWKYVKKPVFPNNTVCFSSQKEYLQVVLPYLADIRKIATEGNVTSYTLTVSRDGIKFRDYNPSASSKQLVCIFVIFTYISYKIEHACSLYISIFG
jgi:hypothetical protein